MRQYSATEGHNHLFEFLSAGGPTVVLVIFVAILRIVIEDSRIRPVHLHSGGNPEYSYRSSFEPTEKTRLKHAP